MTNNQKKIIALRNVLGWALTRLEPHIDETNEEDSAFFLQAIQLLSEIGAQTVNDKEPKIWTPGNKRIIQ